VGRNGVTVPKGNRDVTLRYALSRNARFVTLRYIRYMQAMTKTEQVEQVERESDQAVLASNAPALQGPPCAAFLARKKNSTNIA
jgi:hypothetical protein